MILSQLERYHRVSSFLNYDLKMLGKHRISIDNAHHKKNSKVQFHDEVEAVLGVEDVVEGDDVRMVYLASIGDIDGKSAKRVHK